MTSPPPDAAPHAEAVDTVITTRRTCLRMDTDTPLDAATVTDLCRLATWAPNHHRTEPWRFAAFEGDGRSRLGDTIADLMQAADAPPAKVAKTRTKYLRAPLMLLVGSAPGATPIETAENRDAVAAGVQNILLGATARGLASFWSSVATPSEPALLDLCGFEPGTHVIAAIYLGRPAGACEPPRRTAPAVHWVHG